TAILQASRGDLGQVFDDDAEGVVLTYAPIWGTNWGLALRMTRADLYAQVWSEIRGVAMWFVLLLLAGALATLRMTHSMSGKVLVRAEQWVSRVAAKEESEHALAMRTKEFETILETVDQGIAMVDSALRVVAVNRRYCELMDVPVELLQPGCPFENVVRYNARRGEHGDCEVETLVIERIAMWRRFERDRFERTRPDGTILQIEIQPVSGGGIVMTYTDVTQQRRSEERAAHIGRLLDESLNEIYVFDAQTLRFIGVNRGALRNLGYTMDELRALTPVDLKPMYSMKQFADLLNPLSTGVEQRLSFITAHRRKDGTDYPVDIHLQCSRSEGRDVFVAMILDVSEREASAAAMRDGEMRYRALYDDNPSMFFTIDSQAKIVSVNRFGAEQLGYTPEELIGSPLTNLTIDSDAVLERTHIKACLRAPGTVHRCDVSKRHRDGRTIWVRESARVVADGVGETMILLVCEDVTETRELSEQLAYFAAHDTLTGLPNRREFENRLDAALESASREDCEHALCYLDLDQFKVVNDTCGHTAGDELLRQIAKLLLGTVRNTDTLARLGGDEFGLLVTHCPLANAERIADTVRALIEDFHFSWEEQSFRIGVSIGVVPITRHSEGRAALMSGADAACYVAKNSGRNRVHVFHRDDVDVARHQGDMGWIGRIQDALECNRLHLDFQAIVPLSSDHVEGEHYEVLLRMIDTDGTLVPPGQFLPVAERYNLAPRIDRWVISTALDWLSTNPAHLEQLSMCSINLSGLSLTDEHFAAFVLAAFRSSGVPPAKICFEITETAAISNLTSAMELVAELRDVGCHFALDDFGSGLSSFGYLKHLPVEFVKIDGMFVKDILDDPIDFAMVRPINEIAHVLGKRTIAEFVENDAILEAVREIGIDFAQGYGVGRPQPLTTLNDKVLSMPRGALNRVCTTSTLHLPCVNAPTSIERNVGAT
ncbi:MAG: diguanylate cyclase (GGDEF)-like protein/PAS domain S-box-containing protein, partial [Gammaproteobacteria bacterium]